MPNVTKIHYANANIDTFTEHKIIFTRKAKDRRKTQWCCTCCIDFSSVPEACHIRAGRCPIAQ